MKTYRLGDALSLDERKQFGLTASQGFVLQSFTDYYPHKVKAIRTGEYRKPRKGEWFLSGADPLAYKAPNDLLTDYHIMILVSTDK